MRRNRLALLCLLALPSLALATETSSDTVISVRSRLRAVTADPRAAEWQDAPAIEAGRDPFGNPVPGHQTEIRSRWTKDDLYLLFSCRFEQLYLKPDAVVTSETNRLWEWDVAEAFIGSDLTNIDRYKEFEASPQGEWVDLDIDRKHPLPEGGWLWNSRFTVKTRIDAANKIWYAEMRIPFEAISPHKGQAGQKFRVNFYRMQGPPPDRHMIAWRPTHERNYHVPAAFGTLLLK